MKSWKSGILVLALLVFFAGLAFAQSSGSSVSVNVTYPKNNTNISYNDSGINFNLTLRQNGTPQNLSCSLYIDSKLNMSYNVSANFTVSINVKNLGVGNHTCQLNCTNKTGYGYSSGLVKFNITNQTNCTNQCYLGQTKCNGTLAQNCTANAQGCYIWGPAFSCGANYACQNNTCRANQTQNRPPTVSLMSPANNVNVSSPVIGGIRVSDDTSTWMNCSLMINKTVRSFMAQNNIITSSPAISLNRGTYYWNVSCYDSQGARGNSPTYRFTVKSVAGTAATETPSDPISSFFAGIWAWLSCLLGGCQA